MNQSHLFTKKSPPDIDALLQNSYLLVVELCRGVQVKQGDVVWQHCTSEIARTRQALCDAGVNGSAVEHISYAQCALLDETVLTRAPDEGYAAWRSTSLQAHFFGTAEAGNRLYERIRTVLDEPVPDQAVLTCFHRVLLLGFQGRCQEDTALIREQLITRLSQQTVPFGTLQSSPALAGALPSCAWLRSIGGPLIMTIIMLTGVWWGLGRYLATLFPGWGQ
ncbi:MULTISPECIES: type VI secretion system protein TssL, short form [Photorhabdus]|uniref:Type VI secretion protein ImpK n=1 Tax=Photorhabdus thracensis TaxID=230089 RepID=A0A0F7LJB6_9GAMM|nr:type VI secretion system protein TssL, short form [Photorhabdus thracensis]AKH61996.1 type VI secretion protein ImpK [Photorhabdus thracensis]AKH62515.1 type VI secretion protein ImpK [Photorhabdus thracensis]AKH65688.1 type VI secretion protein ImpK [Photorhabdus thracensis]MCC8422631.1 type VI secretion system protein TssL, short form [Photorhabdus thracensis]